MLMLFRDDGSVVHPTSIVSNPGPTSTRSPSPDMLFRRHLIQRWIGDEVSSKTNVSPRSATSTAADPDEAQARQTHDHLAALDWEREEFEREMALHFVVNDLSLGLDEQGSAVAQTPTPSARPSDARSSKSIPRRWQRSPSSASTLQPLTPPSASTTIPSISFPSASLPPSPPARPTSLLASMLRPPHRSSLSVYSLPASHFSSCTSSSDAPSVSTPSLFSQVGRKLVPKFNGTEDLPQSLYRRPRRHVSVPARLTPKKRRLIVRGIGMDDERAIEGVKRWANGLGAVSRVSRTQDGTLWIEFQDKWVAQNVCCLQAQVQIPNVGRVILDWAEGRHPG